jgi:hypothetical protein
MLQLQQLHILLIHIYLRLVLPLLQLLLYKILLLPQLPLHHLTLLIRHLPRPFPRLRHLPLHSQIIFQIFYFSQQTLSNHFLLLDISLL